MRRAESFRLAVRRELALVSPRSRPGFRHWTALAVLLGCLGSGGAEAQPPFRQEVVAGFSSFDVGDNSSPRLADLDGDGHLDLLAGELGGRLRYFMGSGLFDPAFAEASGAENPLAAANAGQHARPALADLDGDGDLDAAVGGTNGFLLYFRNTGSVSAPAFAAMTGAGENPFAGLQAGTFSHPTFGDLDGDGDLDALVGEGFGHIQFWRNSGSSAAPAFAIVPPSANPLKGIDVGYWGSPELGDLDGDGDLDALSGSYAGTIVYLRNTGSATAPAFAGAATANPFAGIDFGVASMPELVDVDGDLDLDAAIGEANGGVFFYTNIGSPTAPAMSPASSRGIEVRGFAYPELVDLDGDGDRDAVVGEAQGLLNYYVNSGSAVRPIFVEATGSDNPLVAVLVGGNCSPDLADLDGDGDFDAVVGEEYGILNYVENTGSPAAPEFVAFDPATGPFAGIDVGGHANPVLADLDGDGDRDAVVGDFTGHLAYLENTGSAAVPAFVLATGAANPLAAVDLGETAHPELADLDFDGDLDAIAGDKTGQLFYFENTGTSAAPAFVARTGSANPLAAVAVGGDWAGPNLVDVDADGDLDAIVGEELGRLVLYRSRAADLFADGFESGDPSAWDAAID